MCFWIAVVAFAVLPISMASTRGRSCRILSWFCTSQSSEFALLASLGQISVGPPPAPVVLAALPPAPVAPAVPPVPPRPTPPAPAVVPAAPPRPALAPPVVPPRPAAPPPVPAVVPPL